MRVAFLASDKPRERILADAFLMGARKHGHHTEAITLGEEPEPGTFDVVCMVGVKSRERFRAQHRAGARVVYLDKGYSRHKSPGPRAGWEYWRVAIDAHQPTDRLDADVPHDRLDAQNWELAPWRAPRRDGVIVLAGSSAKYHEFYGLPHPTTYAKEIVRQLRAFTDRPIVYRPKPSWREATPIRKTRFSQTPETLADVLGSAHVLITHGSNACFEAVLAGVPCIVLGDGVAKPISSTTLDELASPRLAGDDERRRWAANIACWQYTEAEMASGQAWDFIGRALHG